MAGQTYSNRVGRACSTLSGPKASTPGPSDKRGEGLTTSVGAGKLSLSALQREADQRICSIHRVVEALRDGVEQSRPVGQVIDLVQLEARAGYIAALRSLHSELQKLVALVGQHGAAVDAAHKVEIRAVQDSLQRALLVDQKAAARCAGSESSVLLNPDKRVGQPPSDSDDKRAGQLPSAPPGPDDRRPNDRRPNARPLMARQLPDDLLGEGRAATSAAPPATVSKLTQVLGKIALDAVLVPADLKSAQDIFGTISPGELHFIPQWHQFAVKIGSMTFHSNIAHIYPSGGRVGGFPSRDVPTPERVKDCRKGAQCSRSRCRFFHDPATCPGSTDTRNFIADSWMYSPSAAPAGFSSRGSRRFGSAEFLEADLAAMSRGDATMFVQQTAHDLICALILQKYVLLPAA